MLRRTLALAGCIALSQNNSFGPNLDRVQSILDGRVVRVGVQVDF